MCGLAPEASSSSMAPLVVVESCPSQMKHLLSDDARGVSHTKI